VYKEVTNSLIKIINGEAYKKKEKVVETISKLLIENNEFGK
jgi:dihydroneopterin aldolase